MPISQINTNSIAPSTGLTTPTFSGNTNMTGGTKYQVGGVTTNALAWVNFVGSSGVRNASYNVSSVTRNATGDYTVNFASALTDANYAAGGMAQPASNVNAWLCGDPSQTAPTTTAYRFKVAQGNFTNYDATSVSIAFFGN